MSRVARVPSAENCTLAPARHWQGVTRICDGEFIAQGHQHEGMSGSAVLNGCGYVGVAHAARIPAGTRLANFAAIIPAKAVIDFIDLHASKLPTLADCGMQAVLPPVAVFVDCLNRQLPVCLTGNGSCSNPSNP